VEWRNSLRGSVHLGTKGCLCDFTFNLDDVRIKVLSAFVCSYCSQALSAEGHPALPAEIRTVLGKQWLGRRDDPASPSGIVSKLGYDLFTTKGLTARWHERLLAGVQEEGAKQLVAVAGAILIALIAVLLLSLNINIPSDEQNAAAVRRLQPSAAVAPVRTGDVTLPAAPGTPDK
jgi:hypothetical protein